MFKAKLIGNFGFCIFVIPELDDFKLKRNFIKKSKKQKMGKSYNTTPPKIKAEKAYNDLKDKSTFYPRVIERKPYPGDTHPVSKQKIQKILPYIAKEYIYGLTEIELRAREPNRGKPLGYYGIIDQKIVLYSMPKIMRIKAKSPQRLKEYYELRFRTLNLIFDN